MKTQTQMINQTPKRKGTTLTIRLNHHQQNQFEVRCIENQTSMSEVLRCAIETYICSTIGKDTPNLLLNGGLR